MIPLLLVIYGYAGMSRLRGIPVLYPAADVARIIILFARETQFTVVCKRNVIMIIFIHKNLLFFLYNLYLMTHTFKTNF